MLRRHFLVTSLALPALAHRLAHSQAHPLGRSHGRSHGRSQGREWGVSAAAGLTLGYAAITWGGRDDAAIDDIASLGFRGIQLRTAAFDRWGDSPETLTALLESRKLAFVAFSSGMLRLDAATFDDDMALHLKHARFVRACGGQYLQVVDERPRGRAPTPEDFAAMAKRLNELGKRTADLGITLAYHNHFGNLGQAPDEVEAVLSRTDPKLVRLLLDIAHWQAGGGDPVQAVRRYADRLAFLHLKDLQRLGPEADGRSFRFVELGKGEVDVRGVLAELSRTAYAGWGIVELDAVTDPSLTPLQCALRSKDYLASIGYTT